MELGRSDIPGRRLGAVTVAWYEHDGRRVEWPVHLWLHLDGLGAVQVHTPGSGSLDLRVIDPYDGYAMDSGARVVVEAATADSHLTPFVGEVIRTVRELRDTEHDQRVGIVLDFANGSVGIANVADDLVLLPWPSAAWSQKSIELARS